MNSFVINRFEKSFGPMGSSAGLFLLIGGFALLYYSYSSLFLILLGMFLAFTNTSTAIDFNSKRVRFSNNICGIFKFGKWIDVQPDMIIKIQKNRHVFRSYSRSNRTLDIKTHQYQVILCNPNNETLAPLKYTSSYSEAQIVAHELTEKFNIGSIL